MSLTIQPVATWRDLERFIRLPWQVYAEYPAWVPPLLFERRKLFRPRTNPFLRHVEAQLFLALRGSQAVGTIAAFIDRRASQFQRTPTGYFGFFEVLPDPPAAAALLNAAEQWARARGMRLLQGPYNFSYDNDCGLLLNAYDQSPVVMTAYNPPYYVEFVQQAGLDTCADWYAYTIDQATLGGSVANLPARLQRTAHIAQQRSGIHIRSVRLRDFEPELMRVLSVYNRAWNQNYGFVPLDDDEAAHLARSVRPVVDADLVLVAEVQGEVVGASITLPDLNQMLRPMRGRLLPTGWWYLLRRRRYIDTVRLFALGVVPEYRRRGIEAAFFFETFRAAVSKGYQRAELSLVHETNQMTRRSAEALGARINKTYRIYEKPLG